VGGGISPTFRENIRFSRSGNHAPRLCPITPKRKPCSCQLRWPAPRHLALAPCPLPVASRGCRPNLSDHVFCLLWRHPAWHQPPCPSSGEGPELTILGEGRPRALILTTGHKPQVANHLLRLSEQPIGYPVIVPPRTTGAATTAIKMWRTAPPTGTQRPPWASPLPLVPRLPPLEPLRTSPSSRLQRETRRRDSYPPYCLMVGAENFF
jgi:hypothetical protein